jgi:hypothetical protein
VTRAGALATATRKGGNMHAVVRTYTGEGASTVFDLVEKNADEVKELLGSIPGFVSYTAIRTAGGGVTVTVCEDKAGTDESSTRAAGFVKERSEGKMIDPPTISDGDTSLHFGN